MADIGKKKGRLARPKIIEWIIIGLLLAMMAVSIGMFFVNNSKQILANNHLYIKETTLTLQRTMDRIFRECSSSAENNAISAAHLLYNGFVLKTKEDGTIQTQREAALDYLKSMANNSSFSYVELMGIVDDEFGIDGYQYLSSRLDKPPESTEEDGFVDLRHRDYYKRGVKGETGVEYIAESQPGKEKVFVFYAPVINFGFDESQHVSEYNSRYVGVMTGIVKRDDLRDLLSAQFFGNNNRITVMSRDGATVFPTFGLEYDNFFDKIATNTKNSPSKMEDIRTLIRELPDEGVSMFDFYTIEENQKIYAAVVKLKAGGEQNDWVMVQAFPPQAVKTLVNSLSSAGAMLGVELCVLFFLGLSLVLWWTYNRRRTLKYQNSRMEMIISELPGLLIEQVLGESDITVRGGMASEYNFGTHQENLYEAVYPEDLVKLTDAYDQVMRGNEKVEVDLRLRKKNGEYGWVNYCMRYMQESTGYNRLLAVATNVDKQLRERQEKSDILSSLNFAFIRMYYVDLRTKRYAILQYDDIIRALPEYGNLDTIRNHIISTWIASEDADSVRNFYDLNQVVMTEENRYVEIEYCTRNGGYERLTYVAVNTEDGQMSSMIVATQDISAQKKIELSSRRVLEDAYAAAKSASEAKTTFLSRMSHDIRTPMNSIIGMTFLAQNRLKDSDYVKECLSKIMISGNHLLTLLNEVLDMSRIETQSTLLEEESFDMSALLSETSELAKSMAETRNQNFTFVQKLPHRFVRGDRKRLQQILINFLSNAAKYTAEGGSFKLIAEENSFVDGRLAVDLSVEDTGVGMTAEEAEHVFEPFYRAEDSRISKTEGTGLGLSIAYNLAKLMNGDISVKTERGKGSVFTLHIVMTAVKNAKEASVKKEEIKIVGKFDGYRVLLVEDNDLNREIAVELLKMTGVGIETACNGAEAVEKIAANPPHYYGMVFMDVQMPVCNGYEATVRIRAMQREDAAILPIVAMTANAFADDVADAKKAGMNGHMSKPVTVERLTEMLQRYLSSKK